MFLHAHVQIEKLKQCGVDKIACAAIAPSAQLEEWAKRAGNKGQVGAPDHADPQVMLQVAWMAAQPGGAVPMSGSCEAATFPHENAASHLHCAAVQISLIADEDGGMTRMLGLDLPATGKTDAGGPRSQRCVCLVVCCASWEDDPYRLLFVSSVDAIPLSSLGLLPSADM